MYRDDPLDDEAELREIVGDAAVDRMVAARPGLDEDPVLAAVDILRLLQGWVDDEQAGSWFVTSQRRLDDESPVDALCDGSIDEALDAARAWAAAQG